MTTKKSITQGSTYSGVSFFITLEKDENAQGVPRYTASARLCFPTHVEVFTNWWPLAVTGSTYFYSNPYKNCYDECIGLIDARLSQDDNNPLKLEAIQMAKMSPRTEPTPEQLNQMREQIQKLVAAFTAPGIAALAGIRTPVVQAWIARGRISAQAASDICKIPEVAAAGFTREAMRPDVVYWYTDAREKAANQ